MSASSERFITETDISENQDAEDELTDLVLSGESVALVGAGYSYDCGFPSWGELLDILRERAEELDPEWGFEPVPESLLEHADRIHECIASARNNEAFGDEVGRIFRTAEQAMEAEVAGLPEPTADEESSTLPVTPGLRQFHLQLVRLPFRGFLTTNYDHMLEHALARSGRCAKRAVPVPVWGGDPMLISRAIRGLAVAGSVRHVIHLHGDYRQLRTVILTGGQYSDAYGLAHAQRSRLFHLLVGILMTRRLVFVGFGLRDEYIEEMLALVSDFGWEWGEPIHFAILPRTEDKWPEQKKEAIRLRKKLGVQAVFYDARSNDHSELHRLIKRIYQAYEATKEREKAESRAPVRPGPGLPEWAQRANQAAVKKVGDHEN